MEVNMTRTHELTALQQKRCNASLFCEKIYDYINFLKERKYSPEVRDRLLAGLYYFDVFLIEAKICDLKAISHNIVLKYLNDYLPTKFAKHSGSHRNAISGFNRFRYYLETIGDNFLSNNSPGHRSPQDNLLSQYDDYLTSVRVLTPHSKNTNLRIARIFLSYWEATWPDFAMIELSPKEIHKTLCNAWDGKSNRQKKRYSGTMRSFLQFLFWHSILSEDLSAFVPTIKSQYSDVQFLSPISKEQICALLNLPDRKTPTGKKDYAILLLLASTGMRAGEIAKIQLTDIDWHSKTISVNNRKNERAILLPLYDECVDALYGYIKNSRPQMPHKEVFLCENAPHFPHRNGGTVSWIASKYLKRINIHGRCGAHSFRTALATTMVNNGCMFKHIGDVLGHNNTQSTERYARVNLNSMEILLQPFPICLEV